VSGTLNSIRIYKFQAGSTVNVDTISLYLVSGTAPDSITVYGSARTEIGSLALDPDSANGTVYTYRSAVEFEVAAGDFSIGIVPSSSIELVVVAPPAMLSPGDWGSMAEFYNNLMDLSNGSLSLGDVYPMVVIANSNTL
jgi:hypothetical protein